MSIFSPYNCVLIFNPTPAVVRFVARRLGRPKQRQPPTHAKKGERRGWRMEKDSKVDDDLQ
eukprot:scaffold6464_cov145-Skeletonema_menzelii.AAC.19